VTKVDSSDLICEARNGANGNLYRYSGLDGHVWVATIKEIDPCLLDKDDKKLMSVPARRIIPWAEHSQ